MCAQFCFKLDFLMPFLKLKSRRKIETNVGILVVNWLPTFPTFFLMCRFYIEKIVVLGSRNLHLVDWTLFFNGMMPATSSGHFQHQLFEPAACSATFPTFRVCSRFEFSRTPEATVSSSESSFMESWGRSATYVFRFSISCLIFSQFGFDSDLPTEKLGIPTFLLGFSRKTRNFPSFPTKSE